MNLLENVLPKLKLQNPPTDPTERVHKIPVCRILPNPAQPRKYFDSDETLRLADSIRRHGILQPLCVRKPISVGDLDDYGGVYELIAGERRLRAAKLLGMAEVPCIVVEADSLRSAELAIIENLQREDLNMFDEASAISALIDLYGLTQEEVAAKLSASQSYVANKLRLLRFDDFERQVIIERRLTERHARASPRRAGGGDRARHERGGNRGVCRAPARERQARKAAEEAHGAGARHTHFLQHGRPRRGHHEARGHRGGNEEKGSRRQL